MSNHITLISPSDLKRQMSNLFDEKFEEFRDWFESKLIQGERPLTAIEAMEYLSMSRATFYRYVKSGKIPQHGFGSKRYYFKSDLDNMIKKLN